MSAVTEQPGISPPWRERLRPRDEDHGGRTRGYRVETVILVLVALILSVATVYDVVRQVHINDRMHADLVSWRTITGRHGTHEIIEQDTKTYTTRDVVCGRTVSTPAAPALVCLIFQGPVKAGRRELTGGYFLLETGRRKTQVVDVPRHRYACFGDAAALHFRCLAAAPPGAPDKPL